MVLSSPAFPSTAESLLDNLGCTDGSTANRVACAKEKSAADVVAGKSLLNAGGLIITHPFEYPAAEPYQGFLAGPIGAVYSGSLWALAAPSGTNCRRLDFLFVFI